MPSPRRALAAVFAAAVLPLSAGVAAAPASAAPAPPAATYTVGVGSPVPYAHPTDTQASPYLDKDGTFYFQQSAALYGANDPRYWDFFTGPDFDTATRSGAISGAVNPANGSDRNDDTTWRCNNSPTGREATAAPSGSGYAQKNYCDLAGVWVDPDTGDWYGLVHNEFTPQPFGDGLHFDAIDYAVSKDQGRTWTIADHVITSPYSTTRGDTAAFPNQTYSYGDGDQRLYVDTASGYFYVFYGSRIVDKNGGWKAFYEHAARAPISAKMAPGSWRKWYDGAWTQPGTGGRESNIVPVGSGSTTGYTPVSGEYDPANTGTAAQQIAAGTMPPTSPLFVMNITYDAHLKLYVGEPQAVDQSGSAPQQLYATADLSTQKWFLLGDTGSYRTASWYRWFLDGASRTGGGIVGRSFRSYCAFGCAKKPDGSTSSGEYVDVTLDASATAPGPVDETGSYRIAGGAGRVLAQVSGGSATTSTGTATGSALESWTFTGNGDGSYRIANAATGGLLGVDSTTTAGRAWGARPTVTAAGSGGPAVGQQWWVVPGTAADNTPTGTVRLVNRYSGLVIGLSADAGRPAETTPARSWTNTTGNPVGGTRTAGEQTLTLTRTGSAPESVSVSSPGDQSGSLGTAVSLRLTAHDSAGKPLTFTATGLPAGLTISPAGLVSGTPTAAGASTVTVTASSGTATGTVSFGWTVAPVLSGAHTLVTGGKALDDPDHSLDQGTRLITWGANGGSNQSWTFTRQSDGSYQITNVLSHLCVDVSGGSGTAGAQIIQWACTGGANQRWTVTPTTNGYRITSRSSGLSLTTASTANGAAVTQQTDTGSALQRWTIG
ncbi:ricin-type beta-trefoil lectin protein [Kitasatospora sp. SolWspMP-SS2h]|uniref:RICIN domain-containing protein n=1 Tax=Kitasatospora sp. SolWspMP-SS2h TaxID=1305729 RepID=UPI000DB99A02|nr:RICIN domain-containing protein [Kitasatospora sp. SolWspMP-SS2h]RAJ46333.1 ricin-type beta-trefoil lectin protein [Kitasatospora sp. SolWspMP-SS2h]